MTTSIVAKMWIPWILEATTGSLVIQKQTYLGQKGDPYTSMPLDRTKSGNSDNLGGAKEP